MASPTQQTHKISSSRKTSLPTVKIILMSCCLLCIANMYRYTNSINVSDNTIYKDGFEQPTTTANIAAPRQEREAQAISEQPTITADIAANIAAPRREQEAQAISEEPTITANIGKQSTITANIAPPRGEQEAPANSEQPTIAALITIQPCALLFFGLPRAYKEMVLPSIVRNILIPNARHQCDIYVHYYHQHAEKAGRGNRGGAIDPNDILLLKKAGIDVAKDHGGRLPRVEFVNDTEKSFWKKRGTSLEIYHNTTDQEDRPLYFPWKTTFLKDSLTNIVKQWHSIDSVFTLMETTSQLLHNVSYVRVGMFRSDVMFVTPIDIAFLDRDKMDVHNQHVVLAPFGKHPVNDRMIYGPLEGVKVWATKRFELIEKRVKLHLDPGFEMHSERFLNATILPAIKKLGVSLYTNPDICFLRTRADKSVLRHDCDTNVGKTRDLGPVKPLVESIVGTSCHRGGEEEVEFMFRFLSCDFGGLQAVS